MPVINMPRSMRLPFADGREVNLRAGINNVDDEIANHAFFKNTAPHLVVAEEQAKVKAAAKTGDTAEKARNDLAAAERALFEAQAAHAKAVLEARAEGVPAVGVMEPRTGNADYSGPRLDAMGGAHNPEGRALVPHQDEDGILRAGPPVLTAQSGDIEMTRANQVKSNADAKAAAQERADADAKAKAAAAPPAQPKPDEPKNVQP